MLSLLNLFSQGKLHCLDFQVHSITKNGKLIKYVKIQNYVFAKSNQVIKWWWWWWWWWIVFFWYGSPTKGVSPYFQPGPLSDILSISNLRHAASRIWTCAEATFRLCWMMLCSIDNHYTTAPLVIELFALFAIELFVIELFAMSYLRFGRSHKRNFIPLNCS